MKCEFCGAEAEGNVETCPSCGKPLQGEHVSEIAEAFDAVSTETGKLPDKKAAKKEKKASEDKTDKKAPQKSGVNVTTIISITCAVLLLSTLAALLLSAFGVFDKLFEKAAAPVETLPTEPSSTSEVQTKDVYTADDAMVIQEANTVVATIGDKQLTNAELRIYYRMQLDEFLNMYGSYMSMLGLDLTMPLSAQQSYYDPNVTWEQYFLDIALKTWQNTQSLALLAEEAGFVLDESYQTQISELPKMFDEQAAANGYESADAMIQELLGGGCSIDSYIHYITMMITREQFYASEYERLMPTDEECETYFAENEELFLDNDIHKESGLVGNVRHILVCPKGGTTDENGVTTYSDEEWNACLAEAEKILDEWKAGDATEESFAALVPTYTEDPGSSTTGGLYTDINPTSSYVENFLNWTVDMTRQPGDTGIVKTEYGYHIMYFVSGEPHWLATARVALLSERTTAMIDDAESKWPMSVDYSKIVLNELNVA